MRIKEENEVKISAQFSKKNRMFQCSLYFFSTNTLQE